MSLDQPLALVLIVPLIGIFLWIRWRRHRLILQAKRLSRLIDSHRPSRELAAVLRVFSLLLLLIALASPRWGLTRDQGALQGRDLVILVDLSRSMLAEDLLVDGKPVARWRGVQAGVRQLIETMEQRGGHRLGIVVFATEAWILAPLTADIDFLKSRLIELDPEYPPPEILPKTQDETKSGTQMGEAIRIGSTLFDSSNRGFEDLLLVTDGDDPDELREVGSAVTEVVQKGIPLHVIGVGDPLHGAMIEQLDLISIMQEQKLRSLARSGRGEFLTWERDLPAIGEFVRNRIDLQPNRLLQVETIAQRKAQYHWFLGLGLILLMLSWLLENRKR